jgi:hypothetical protein
MGFLIGPPHSYVRHYVVQKRRCLPLDNPMRDGGWIGEFVELWMDGRTSPDQGRSETIADGQTPSVAPTCCPASARRGCRTWAPIHYRDPFVGLRRRFQGKSTAIRSGRCSKNSSKVQPKRRGRRQAHCLRYLVDGCSSRFKAVLSSYEPLVDEPLVRRGSRLVAEAPAAAHAEARSAPSALPASRPVCDPRYSASARAVVRQ